MIGRQLRYQEMYRVIFEQKFEPVKIEMCYLGVKVVKKAHHVPKYPFSSWWISGAHKLSLKDG